MKETHLLASSQCAAFESNFDLNFYISLFLCVGIFFSYVPQYIRIVIRKSSEGISPWFLLLGIISSFCAFFNILLVSKSIYQCCSEITTGQCFSASLAIIQITVQSLASALVLILALIFTRNQNMEPKEEYYRLQYTGKICLSFFVCVGALSFYTYHHGTVEDTSILANILGVIGAILAAAQYFPQIYTTTHLQHVGSLSIPMMCLQTPGGFLWSATLAAREGTKWSSWLPYFTAAVLQGTLLALAIYYEYSNKRFEKDTRRLLDGAEGEEDAFITPNSDYGGTS